MTDDTQHRIRCDTCGHTLPAEKFKPRGGGRDPTCRKCARGTRVIHCVECGHPFRARRRSHAERCHRCRLRRRLKFAIQKSPKPRTCKIVGCDERYLPLGPWDRKCAIHGLDVGDRHTYAHGECVMCGETSDYLWSVDVPVCVACLKTPPVGSQPSNRQRALNSLRRPRVERDEPVQATGDVEREPPPAVNPWPAQIARWSDAQLTATLRRVERGAVPQLQAEAVIQLARERGLSGPDDES